MCFDFDCCGNAIGNILYVGERLVSCFAMTAVVTCLVATLMTMLAMGIGLGYNYCFIDSKILREKSTGLENDPSMRSKEDLDTNKFQKVASVMPADIRKIFSATRTTNRFYPPTKNNLLPRQGNGGQKSHLPFHRYRHNGKRSVDQPTPKESTITGTTSSSSISESSATFSSSTVTDALEINPTMVISLKRPDLLSLIKTLSERHTNITLELIQ